MAESDEVPAPTERVVPDDVRRDDRPLATIALASTTLALAASFSRVFEYGAFLPSLITIAAFAHLVAFALRRGGVSPFVAFLAQTAVVILANAWIQLRETLWFGLPLGRTWNETWALVTEAANQVGEVTPPIAFDTGFGIVAGLSVGLVAILADAFAFRAAGRGEALVPSAVVFAIVAIVGEDRHRLLVTTVWLATAIMAVTTLRRTDSGSARRRFRFSTIVVAVAVALLSAYIGPRLPGARSEALIGRDSGSGGILEPLVDVRGRLGDRSDTILFTVVADRAAYWRITSLAEFDGTSWGIDDSDLDAAGGRLATGIDPTSSWFVTQTYTIENFRGIMAPAAFEPTELRAASRSLFYELESGTLLVTGTDLAPRDSYTIVSAGADPQANVLDSASSLAPPSARYLEFPDTSETRMLADLARQITAGADSSYEAAIDLQNYFRDNFAYSLDVPPLEGGDAYAAFLERRSGYCEQFASTFAAMARAIGIPSRVAIGFTPGESTGPNTYVVRSQHAHAWPEVWFDGLGWLMFEPTPGRGAPDRSYTGVEPQQDSTSPEPTATTTPDSVATTTPSNVTTPPDPGSTTTTTVPSASVSTDDASSNDAFVAALVLLFGVLAWLSIVRLIVSRAARNSTDDPLLILWRRLLATEGFVGNAHLTPTEIAAQLKHRSSSSTDTTPETASDAVERLASAVDELLFDQRSPSAEELANLVAQVEARLEWRRRTHPPTWRHRVLRRVSPRLALKLAGLGPSQR